jgi:NAD-dependent deacetylase sirtuin 5
MLKLGLMALSISLGLSPRAGHPAEQLHLLHGSLFEVRCTEFYCKYVDTENYDDPIVHGLAIPIHGAQPEPVPSDTTGAEAASSLYAAMNIDDTEADISDARVPLPKISEEELPHCPKCKTGLLRPGVVWFGERLPLDTLGAVDKFLRESTKIDLMMVIGTSAQVYPAAGYVNLAREKGARVAVINMERSDIPEGGLDRDDWFFQGDAGEIVPEILKSVIGSI